MERVRIALLADPHLCIEARRRNALSLLSRMLRNRIDTTTARPRYGVATKFNLTKPTSFDDEPLIAAANFLEEVSSDLDLLVVLGDLATTGMEDDMDVAEQVFLDDRVSEHLNADLSPRIGGLGIKLHVVPGNHDRYKDDMATPGETRFDDVFHSIYKPRNGVYLSEIKKRDLSVAVVSADFCFADGASVGYLRRLGRGTVDDVVLSELEHQTRTWQKENPGNPVLWALHFSPADGVSFLLKLEDREKVSHLARSLGVRRVVCGHTHEREHVLTGDLQVHIAGSVSSIDSFDNHFLHTCDYFIGDDGSPRMRIIDWKYDEALEEFRQDNIEDFA